jgi:hypothetical protein
VDGYWLLHGEAPHRKLHFESRFQESSTAIAKQGAGGVFSFPDLEKDAVILPQLIALCAANPTLDHHALANMAFKQSGITRAHYYRLIHNAPCVHKSFCSTPVPVTPQPSL